MKNIIKLLGTSALFSFSSVAVASAQQVADDGSAQASPVEQEGLQDIVVTAQRRSENLQRAAISVSTAGAEDLKRAAVTEVSGLTALAPALQASRQGSFTIFYIRGVGGPSLNAYSEAPVAYNLDGVYVARADTVNGQFFDIERIEVLKGPQGTLYGRNATAGAINAITKSPEIDKIGGYLNAEYGNYDKKLVEGALNVPIGSRTAARLAFQVIDRDGYFKDGTDDEKSQSARLTVKSELSDTMTLTAGYDYSHLGGRNAGAAMLLPANIAPTRGGLGDPAVSAYFTNHPLNSIVFPGAITPMRQDLTYQDTDVHGFHVQLDADTPVGKLTVLPAYRTSHVRNFATTFAFALGNDTDQEQKSIEVRLASKDKSQLEYVLGAYYFKESSDFRLTADSQFIGVTATIGHPQTETEAVFGQATFHATDRLRLTGGARYTWEDKRLTAVDDNLPPSSIAGHPQVRPLSFTQVAPYNSTVNSWRKFTAFTYKLGVEFDAGINSLVYANYGTGYKSGGFFVAASNNDYDPEKVKSAVIGTKNRFFGNKLQLNAEAFYQKYSDQQFSHLNFINGNAGVILGYATENAGKSRVYGAEVEARFLPTPNTLFALQVQYLNAKYQKFSFFSPDLSVPLSLPAGTIPSAYGCASTLATGAYLVNCSGQPLLQSPEWIIGGAVSQTIDIGNDARIVLDLRSRFESSRQTSENFLAETRAGSNTRTDASVTYHSSDDTYSLALYVNNIENKNVIAASFVNALTPVFSFGTATLRPPRTYGARASIKF